MPLVVSPAERLLHQLRAQPGAAVPDLQDAQRKAGVMVVDVEEFLAILRRALPQFGDASPFPIGGDIPIFDALTAELGAALEAPA